MKPDGRPADPLLSSPRGLRRRNLPRVFGTLPPRLADRQGETRTLTGDNQGSASCVRLAIARLAHASPAEKDGLRPDSIARTGNLSPGSRTQASAQQGSPQSGDCSNWLNGNLCLQKV